MGGVLLIVITIVVATVKTDFAIGTGININTCRTLGVDVGRLSNVGVKALTVVLGVAYMNVR